MKLLFIGFFIMTTSLPVSSVLASIERVIYGVDDRKDVFESKNPLYKKLTLSTAAMISSGQLESTDELNYLITGTTLESDGICADEKFAKQLTAASCSGFLVGNQYLVTAGHCIESLSDCSNYSWVFDFANSENEKTSHIIPKTNVYTCTKIISRALDRNTQDDYALVKLDRVVEGRSPLKFRKTGKLKNKSALVVIGHPSGLPVKIADGAQVRTNTNKVFFQASLDTFGGNSGSAVFDAKTGQVEGILVRGERDYINDSEAGCMRPKVCKETECRGEDVTRITNILELGSL